MNLSLFNRVVVLRDLPDQDVSTGDVGTVVDSHHDAQGQVVGYEIEIFSATGETLAVASVPADAVRPATANDRLAVRG